MRFAEQLSRGGRALKWRVDLFCLLALAGAVLLFFWRAILEPSAFFVQDMMVQNYPFRDFFARNLRAGTLPLWDAAINCGFPLFAEGQAGPLYPFNVATSFLPTYAAISLNIVFHFWLAGAAMYGLLRFWRAAPAAALTAGLSYALSGYMIVRAMSPNFIDVCAWLPLLILLLSLAAREGRLVYWLGATLVLALQLLAGHPQAAAYGLLSGLAYGVYLGVSARKPISYYAALACVPLVAVALAAVQLLPTFELTRLSIRSQGVSWNQFINMSLPPERLIELLLPNLHGNSAYGTYWGREAGFFIQLCPFIGALPLVLAWVALRQRREEPVGFFAVLAAAGLVLSIGQYTGFFNLLYEIPGLHFFRIPTRFLLWFALATSALCGLGVDQLLRQSAGTRVRGRVFVMMLALAAGAVLYLNSAVFLADNTWLVETGGAEFARYAWYMRFDALRLLIVLVVAYVLLTEGGRRYAGIIAPVVVFVELYTFAADFNGTINPEVYTRPPATARAILSDNKSIQPPRVLSLVNERNAPFDWHGGWAVDLSSYRRYNETLRLYSGGLYGLGNALPGWSPLHLSRHWEFARAYPGVARVAGIEYVVHYGALRIESAKPIYDGDIQVSRLGNSYPRAYIAAGYEVVADAQERLRRLRRGAGVGYREVLLEREPASVYGDGRTLGRAEIIHYEPEEVVLRLHEHAGGYLLLSDTFYPGWRAWVDGVESDIMVANHVFRAVAVAPSANEVRFRYEPESFRTGLWISAIASICCGFVLVFGWRRRVGGSGFHANEAYVGPMIAAAMQVVLVVLLYGVVSQWPLWAGAIERSRVLDGWGG
jgi:hypothetical protein